MTFKETKEGYSVYILHRGEDDVSVSTGKVTAVSMPRISAPQMGVFSPAQTQQMVVDVTIDDGVKTRTYTIPEGHSTTYAGNDLVLSTSKEGIVHEVEAMKGRADEVLRSVEKNRTLSSKCERILEEWNPVMKEKRETEERFGKIEDKLGEMSQVLQAISAKLA